MATTGKAGAWDAVLSGAQTLEPLNTILVARAGEIVFSRTFRGPPPDQPVDIRSASKLIVAALLGAALDRGEIASLEATLGEVAPDLIPPDADPLVPEIQIYELLTMQAGLQSTSGLHYEDWVGSRNWVAHALSRPFVALPSERMVYSSGSYHVLGAALTRATGLSLWDQAQERLGQPLGLDIPEWETDPQGFHMGGDKVRLAPEGMIRLGELYRRGGTWEGRQVLAPDWVAESLRPHTFNDVTGMPYGYGWFIGEVGGWPGEVALVPGLGGQILCVVPELGVTLAITSDQDRPARVAYLLQLFRLIGQVILPALADGHAG